MHQIEIGFSTAMALSRKLGNYYLQHTDPTNEICLRTSLIISGYCGALETLCRSSSLNDEIMKKTIEWIKGVDPDGAQSFEQAREMMKGRFLLPKDMDEIKETFLKEVMTTLNMLVALGRRLLIIRELQATGASEAEINKAIHNSSENIF